jgi:hypothetical protein
VIPKSSDPKDLTPRLKALARMSLLALEDTLALVRKKLSTPDPIEAKNLINWLFKGTKFAMLNVKNIAFNIMNFYKVEVPGKAEDFMPKMQSMGVFRPIKPVIFTMTKLKPIEL